MTLEDIEDQLPNGLHDSMVSRLNLDFVSRTAVFELSLWVGDLESDDESVREAHRDAAITLRGLQFCAVDPPDPRYPYAAPEPLWFVDLCSPPGAQLPSNVAPGAFISSFFVNNWNSFVHLSALDAVIEWKEAADDATPPRA